MSTTMIIFEPTGMTRDFGEISLIAKRGLGIGPEISDGRTDSDGPPVEADALVQAFPTADTIGESCCSVCICNEDTRAAFTAHEALLFAVTANEEEEEQVNSL